MPHKRTIIKKSSRDCSASPLPAAHRPLLPLPLFPSPASRHHYSDGRYELPIHESYFAVYRWHNTLSSRFGVVLWSSVWTCRERVMAFGAAKCLTREVCLILLRCSIYLNFRVLIISLSDFCRGGI